VFSLLRTILHAGGRFPSSMQRQCRLRRAFTMSVFSPAWTMPSLPLLNVE
jgi:hypothetical protein